MALVRNIAGFSREPVTIGQAANTAEPGLLSNLVRLTSSAGEAAQGVTPAMVAVQQGINLLPPGKLKTGIQDGLKTNILFEIIKRLIGRKYTTGQYKLGERYIDQVQPTGSADAIQTYSKVPDEAIPPAILLLTILFGVRVTTVEDLDALELGEPAYYARPDKADIPQAAVERAVLLKQNYYPDSLYNTAKWNLEHFGEVPLVAPIPDPLSYGKLYTGPLPGGGRASGGVILVDPNTPLSSIQPQGQQEAGIGSNKLLWVGAALLLFGWWYSENEK